MPDPTPSTAALAQPETVALFVSDLHLQPALPRTTQAFLDFLRQPARHAQQLYLLGDLFEAWVGDDDLATPFNRRIVDAIRAVADSGVAVYWIAGNRDFLVGPEFAAAAGLTRLSDPFVARFETTAGAGKGAQSIVLSHGDTLCTDDLGYMEFRSKVRAPAWQQAFLALSLVQRRAIGAELRDGSRAEQRLKPAEIMDVNRTAVAALFAASGTAVMIHGHTHRPARHAYDSATGPQIRYVLPDWDCDTTPARGGWIALDALGILHRFDINGTELG